MADFVPTAEQLATFQPMVDGWRSKTAAMSPEFRAAQRASMSDPSRRAEREAYFKDTIWPACSKGDFMDMDGYKNMVKMMEKRSDEKLGDHIKFSDDEVAGQFKIYTSIFGNAAGLSKEDFKKIEGLFKAAMATAAGQ